MSYVRPIYGDAASRLSSYSHVSSTISRHRHGDPEHDGIDGATEEARPARERKRLPSQRPINHRWDRIRGLNYTYVRPSATLHQQRASSARTTAQGAAASQRHYAQRPGSQPPGSSGNSSGSSSGGLGSMAQPARQSAPSVQGSPKEVADKLIAQLKSQLGELTKKLSTEQKSMQKAREEIEGLRRKNIDDKEAMLKKGREEGRHAEASKLGQEIRAREQQVHSAKSKQRSAEAEAVDLQSQLARQSKDWAQDREDLSNARQDQERRLLKQSNEHRRELLEMKHSLQERQEQRQTYGTYRNVFEGVHSARVLVGDLLVNMQHDSMRARSTRERLLTEFRAFREKHAGIALFGRILDAAADQHSAVQADVDCTKAHREALRSADMRMKNVAHKSRLYTQTLRYNIHTDSAEILEHVLNYVGDRTLGARVDVLMDEIEDITRRIDKADNSTLKEELQARKGALFRRKAPLDNIQRLFKVQRNYITLKAWREASYPRKAAFEETHDLISKRREVMRKWYDELESLQSRNENIPDKQFEELREARLQHRQRAQQVAEELDKLAAIAKQHADLRQREGRHVEHEREINESIDRKIAQAYKSVHLVEDQLFGELRQAKAASRLDITPKPTVVARSSRAARATKPAAASKTASETSDEQAANLKLADLKQRLQAAWASNDKDEVDKLSNEQRRVKGEVQQRNLDVLIRKRETLPKSRQHLIEANIASLRRSMDSSLARTTQPDQDTKEPATQVKKKPTTPPQSASKKPQTMRERRKTLTIRRTVGRNEYSAEHTAGLNIKPTASKQAVHASRPVLSFRATEARLLPSLLQRETRDLGAKVADARWLAADLDNTPPNAAASSEHSTTTADMALSSSRCDDDDDSNYSDGSSFANVSDFEDDASSSAAKKSEETSKPASNDEPSDRNTSEQDVAPAEDDVPLTYQIPKDDFRKALMASPSSTAAKWSCWLYKDLEGNGVKRHYCTTYEQAETQAKNFLHEKVLGFDLEWEPNAWPGKSSAKKCVSLIQIASEDRVGLFQVALFRGNTAAELMPPSLRQILESPEIVKAGVNIGNDAGRVEKCLDVQMHGLIELSHLYKVVTYSETAPHKVNRKLYKLADQVQEALHLPLAKGEVRTSSWSRRLNPQQVEYAANDAYAGFRLYHAFEAKRKAMTPTPPRPSFWELHEPLVLGNGTRIYPASARATEQRAQPAPEREQVDDDEADEEFFDTVEDIEALEEVAATSAGVPLAGIQVKYPSLPTLEELHISQEDGDVQQAAPERPSKPAATKSKLSSEEAARADEWAAQYRDEHQPIRASQPTLRAYHLWHHQGFTPMQTAALLREEPLSLNTVASYVAEAVMKQTLEYDIDRMREVMDILPKSVWYRYKAIVDKVYNAQVTRDADQ